MDAMINCNSNDIIPFFPHNIANVWGEHGLTKNENINYILLHTMQTRHFNPSGTSDTQAQVKLQLPQLPRSGKANGNKRMGNIVEKGGKDRGSLVL